MTLFVCFMWPSGPFPPHMDPYVYINTIYCICWCYCIFCEFMWALLKYIRMLYLYYVQLYAKFNYFIYTHIDICHVFSTTLLDIRLHLSMVLNDFWQSLTEWFHCLIPFLLMQARDMFAIWFLNSSWVCLQWEGPLHEPPLLQSIKVNAEKVKSGPDGLFLLNALSCQQSCAANPDCKKFTWKRDTTPMGGDSLVCRMLAGLDPERLWNSCHFMHLRFAHLMDGPNALQ